MGRFFGRHEHALDLKGRVFLPAKFRADFVGGGFLTQFNGGCLALWTPAEFESQMGDLAVTQGDSAAQRNKARLFSSGTEEVVLDRQGRLAIAPHLRSFARLSDPELSSAVLVIGVINRVELWNPAVWAERTAASEQRLLIDEE